MEGQGDSRPATVGERPNSTAEQRLEVDVVVSRSSRGCAGNGALLRVERGHRQRQGGNGHGDVVRLLARIPSGGVKCAARTMSVLPPGVRVGFGWRRHRAWESGYPKRSEPHDRQRDATSPRPPSGGNRRGGAKPRGRNGISRMAPRDRSAQRCAREWTLGGSTQVAFARSGVGGGGYGARCIGLRRKPRLRAPHRRTNPTRGGRGSTRGSSESSEGERRPEGRTVQVLPQGRIGLGAVPSEHLEGPRGNAQGHGGSEQADCPLRPRRGHLPVVRFGRRYARP